MTNPKTPDGRFELLVSTPAPLAETVKLRLFERVWRGNNLRGYESELFADDLPIDTLLQVEVSESGLTRLAGALALAGLSLERPSYGEPFAIDDFLDYARSGHVIPVWDSVCDKESNGGDSDRPSYALVQVEEQLT